MKKTIRIVTAALVIICVGTFVFAAGQQEPITAAAGIEAEVTFWTFIEIHQKFYESMAQKFNEENPKTKLVLNTSTIPMNQMHDQLLLSLASGKGAPDFVDIMIRWAGMFYKGNPQYFVSMSDIVAKQGGVMHPERMKTYTDPNGNVLGLPTHLGAGVMYYNKPAFDKAGINVDEIKYYDDWVEVGKKMHRPQENVWFTAQHYAFAREYLLYTMQKGGYMIDPKGNVTVDQKPSIDALQFIYDTLHKHKIAEIAPNGSIYDPAFFDFMNKGGVLALPHAQWYTSRFRTFMPDLSGKIVMRPLPLWRDSKIESASMGGTGTAITAQSKNVDVVKAFLEYCKLSYEGNVLIATEFGFDPPRMDVYDDPRVSVPDPYFQNEVTMNVIKGVLDNFISKPVWEKSTDVQTEISRDILPEVYAGRLGPATAMKNLAAKYR